MILLKILLVLLLILAVLLAAAAVRAALLKPTAALNAAPPPADPDRAAAYAQTLSAMVRQETVSSRFDPDRTKRRRIYAEVCAAFPEYCVFVGGSSSFDMAPRPYNKLYALDLYCREQGIAHENVLFIGDDYGTGGNDESVYLSDVPFLCVDEYTTFPALVQPLLD